MNLTPVRVILIAALAVLVAGLLAIGIFRLVGTQEPAPLAIGLPAEPAGTPEAKPAGTPPPPTPTPTPKPTEPFIRFTGDGDRSIEVSIENGTGETVGRSWGPGATFTSGIVQMLVADRQSADVAPSMRASLVLRAYPTKAAGRPGPTDLEPGDPVEGDLKTLAEALAADASIPPETARTAVLLLSDNPPLDVFALFPRAPMPLAPDLNLESFRVSTPAILDALALLKRLGLPWQSLKAVTDPQLQIEAMYAAESHDKAVALFGIPRQREWVFWKHLLLHGPPPLRHYALFGIARYFPDIALLMHPNWANAMHLPYLFRLSAVRSLAITDRSEAIPLLRRIRRDWSGDPEMVNSADNAIAYLLWKTYRAAPASSRPGRPAGGTPAKANALPGEDGPML
jgi:hypothetical protein